MCMQTDGDQQQLQRNEKKLRGEVTRCSNYQWCGISIGRCSSASIHCKVWGPCWTSSYKSSLTTMVMQGIWRSQWLKASVQYYSQCCIHNIPPLRKELQKINISRLYTICLITEKQDTGVTWALETICGSIRSSRNELNCCRAPSLDSSWSRLPERQKYKHTVRTRSLRALSHKTVVYINMALNVLLYVSD